MVCELSFKKIRQTNIEHLQETCGTMGFNIPRDVWRKILLAINNIADRLETRPTDGPFVTIEGEGFLVYIEEEDIATDVEDGVDTGSEEGEG